MALPAWLAILFSGAKEYVQKKQDLQKLERMAEIEIRKAEIKSQIERIKSNDAADTALDKTSIENTGWKDEYLMLLTTTPMILLFASPFIDLTMVAMYSEDFVYETGMIQRAVEYGFTSMQKAPELYWWLLGAVYIHSLGMRRSLRLFLEKGLNPFKR